MSEENSAKIRVLVVDDSRVVRIAAAKMFGDEFDVVLGVDGADGLRIIESDPLIDVVFTDLAMPEMDGFELLRTIRHHTKEEIRELPVVIATGAGNTVAAKQKAFALGASDFISKPFHGIDLQARAKTYAGFRESNRNLREQVTLDPLTGLFNQKGLQTQLAKEVSFVGRHQSNMTLMKVEIDNYKDLFVRIGREGTEKLIPKVGAVFRGLFRKEDTIARNGLACFTISLPMSDADSALTLANRICQTVEGFKATLDGERIKITVSIGLASVNAAQTFTAEEALDMADAALEKAQESGASQIFHLSLNDFREERDEDARRNLSIDDLLADIEAGNEMSVLPKLDTALARLNPLFSLMSNEHFQSLFEMRNQHKQDQDNNVFSIEKYKAK